MDYKTKTAARTRALAIGAHEYGTHQWPQSLHVCGGALFPTWMPSMFRTTKGLTKKFRSKRLEDRARYRWERVQRCADGSMKFRCQGPVGSARWRTVGLPVRGQQNCPVVARCSARSSVGQWRYPLAGGGLGEADAVAGGHDDVGVVQEPVDGGVGDGLGHEFVEPTWNWHTFDCVETAC